MPDEIERRLNALDRLRQEPRVFWNWLDDAPLRRPRPKDQKAPTWNVTIDDGAVMLGAMEVKDRIVQLSVSTGARAERGGALLRSALGELVARPLTGDPDRRADAGRSASARRPTGSADPD